MKTLLLALLFIPQVASAGLYDWYFGLLTPKSENITLGASAVTYSRTILPIDTTENLGTTTSPWDELHINEICLSADCKTAWPSVSGSSPVSTSTNETAGNLAYWTTTSGTPALLGKVATTSVTCTGGTTCTGFTAIGASPITIDSTTGNWATSSQDYYQSQFGQWLVTGSPKYLAPTTTIGFIVSASSTISDLTVTNGTTTNATSTNLSVSGKFLNATTSAWVRSLSSGLLSGGTLSINADNTKFDIASGNGIIVDNWTNPAIPVVYDITFSGTGISVTNLATDPVTFVLVDNTGAIVQQTSAPTPTQLRDYIFLGQLGHANNTNIANVINSPTFLTSPVSQLRDLLFELGTLNDGVAVSSGGSNLTLSRSAGSLFFSGANHSVDPKDPSRVSVTASSTLYFRLRTQTGAGTNNNTNLDVGNYDNAGTVTAIVGTKFQVFRVFQLVSGNTVIQYGQDTYTTMNDAIDSIPTQSFTVLANLRTEAVLIGLIAVRSSATDLSDDNQARFFTVSKFGEVTSSAGGGITDHGLLSGLTDDDHTQYVTLTGRVGDTIDRATTTQATTTNQAVTILKAISSAGLTIQSNNGTNVALMGAGGGAGVTFYDGVTVTDALTVDTSTLYVDSTNNRVGIGTTTPASGLSVQGNTLISGNITSVANITATGTIALSSGQRLVWGSGTNNSIYYDGSSVLITSGGSEAARFNSSYALDARTSALPIRLGNTKSLVGRNAANGADITIANVDSSDRVRIGANGEITISSSNVGIGTTTPSASLSVQGTSYLAGTTFLGATTTATTSEGYSGRISSWRYLTLSTATSTTWTASTSGAYIPFVTAPFTGTIRDVSCTASSTGAFIGVAPYIGTTPTTPSYFVASSTIGRVTFTSNNTFTVGQSIGAVFGTTTTDSNAKSVSCSFRVTETP